MRNLQPKQFWNSRVNFAYKDHEYLIEISDILLETRSRFLCETCNQNNFGIRALILPEVNLSRF